VVIYVYYDYMVYKGGGKMSTKRVEPWFTEEYAREREAKIDDRIAAGLDPWEPWTEEKAEKLRKETKESAIKFRRETLKSIERLRAEGFVIQTIAELKAKIFELQNPTQDDLYKYTDAYFRDHIKIHEDTLIFFESLLKDKKKLKKTFEAYAEKLQQLEEENGLPETAINTFYPVNFLAPTDKVSNLAFSNELTGGHIQQLAMERRGSKKQITTLASIDFDNLNGSVQIKGRRELTPYDREVHDAIITLYVDGGNEYITPQMIYQVMTGNPDAYLEKKQAEAISDSITKCMYSRLIIDASEEAKAYGFDSFKYDGSLISGERVTASLNGTVVECLRILRPPVLYEYANKKNQIGRFNIKLLNTPINKTEEIITLQGYLYRRILSMKNNSNLSKTIVYDTVYNQLDIKAASDGALRKKKAKVRSQVKKILDYWKQEQFIAGYVENKRGQVIYSVTIRP
jgi:hypothetical protein